MFANETSEKALPDAAIAQQHHNDKHVARVGDHKRRADDTGKQASHNAA